MTDLERAQDLRRALVGDVEVRIDTAVDVALSNADRVSPEARQHLKGLLRFYAKKAHPFRACVLDNRQRFGAKAEAVCAVLRDLLTGTTHWRGKNNPRANERDPSVLAAEDARIQAEHLTDEVADVLIGLSGDDIAALCSALDGDDGN